MAARTDESEMDEFIFCSSFEYAAPFVCGMGYESEATTKDRPSIVAKQPPVTDRWADGGKGNDYGGASRDHQREKHIN